MKKLITLCLSVILASILILPLASCQGKNDETRMMTVELNPQIELLLDSEDKVITVNALNDEGNYVLARVDFVGKTAEEALNAFLKVSVEDGFLLEGELNAGNNNLKISVSGEDAQKLYDKVKESAQDYIDDLENINVNFSFKTITKEDLEALVGDCMRELDVKEIQEKTQEELLKLLETSRQNTEDLLSQELKDCYYSERALEIKQAQLNAYIEAVKEQDNTKVISATLTAIQAQVNNMMNLVTEYKNAYKQYFLDSTSEYYKKTQEYIAAKKQLLEARLEGASEETLNALNATYNQAVATMEACKNAATETINLIDTQIDAALSLITASVDSAVKLIGKTAEDFNDAVTSAVEQAKKDFDAAFNTENKSYIENNYWADMKPSTDDAK